MTQDQQQVLDEISSIYITQEEEPDDDLRFLWQG
jgi:hypothetical protein